MLFLNANTDEAKKLYLDIKDKYPIVITRDLNKAKAWVKMKCQGNMRYGMIASSDAGRLMAEGIFVTNKVNPAHWFLGNEDDVRSSYMMELVATEFDIQGLELDYSVVAWDANYRYVNGKWTYYKFKGKNWIDISKDKKDHSYEEQRRYLKNSYRVLLTRARQGMAIFITAGSDEDKTRKSEWYDGIYNYLKEIGITELK